MKITDKYSDFLEGLKVNPNIKIFEKLTDSELSLPSDRSLRNFKSLLNENGITLSNDDLVFFSFSGLRIVWEGKVTPPGETILDGGFVMNGFIEALIDPTSSDFWRASFGVGPGVETPEEFKHYDLLGWFERRPDGMGDRNRGCFIRQKGDFPPPIAFYTPGWYTPLNMSYEQYLSLMFENYAFKGWQFFYIDISADIPDLDDILENMRIAVKMLPLNFPDKDWSYHVNKYQQTLQALGK